MGYIIQYACVNIRGRVRENNEDNFFAQGRFRRSEQPDGDIVLTGRFRSDENQILAVYDGMGGEESGEVASLIAASGTGDFSGVSGDGPDTLNQMCWVLNRRVFYHASTNNIRCMGTTAAVIRFDSEDISVCNLGDSRIYRLSESGLRQISRDHVLPGYSARKAPITQYLGMPEVDVMLEPHLARGAYRSGDRFLLCSDGITDMVRLEEIARIMADSQDPEQCAMTLTARAMENGGVDNITAIVCQVDKEDGLTSLRSALSKIFIK